MKKFMKTYGLAVLVLTACTLVYSKAKKLANSKLEEKKTPGFIFAFDGGSTGTRLYIYETFRDEKGALDVDFAPRHRQEPLWSKKISPGIAQFSTNRDGIPAYLDELIDFGLEKVQGTDASQVEVLFNATGGMRALSPHDQEIVLSSLRNYFRSKKFFVEDKNIQVIDGSMEGIYAWIAVNKLSGNLASGTAKAVAKKTDGVVEVGGASIQVTFAVPSAPDHHSVPLEFAGVSYNLYSYSYDEFGLMLAQKKWLTPNAVSCLGAVQDLPSTGDFSSCKAGIIATLYNKEFCDVAKWCQVLREAHQPSLPPGMSFVGIDKVYMLAHNFQIKDFSLASLHQKGEEVCALNWDQLLAAYPGVKVSDAVGVDTLGKGCFNMVYLSSVFEKFGFSLANPIKPAEMINSGAPTHTFGAVLLHLSQSF